MLCAGCLRARRWTLAIVSLMFLLEEPNLMCQDVLHCISMQAREQC